MLCAVFVVLLLGIPAIPIGDRNISNLGPVGQVSGAGPGDRVLRLGEPDLTQNVATLNPLLYTMDEEMNAIWLCYDTLLMYDVNKNAIGDLATAWDVSPDGTLWHFKITTHARFYDRLNPTAVHPLTASDVIFTYYLVQNNTNSLQTYFPMIRGQYVISSMWAVNDYEFYIRTNMPFAPMRSSLISVPILPEYIWSSQRFNWLNFDSHAGIPPIVGSGPFYYALDGLPTTGTIELDRSPTWFATAERGWQIHVSKLIYKTETSADTALSDLRTGAIDIDAYPTAAQYLNTLPGMTGVSRWSLVTGGLYEFNMNQMTNADRAAFGGKYKSGSNNQLLLDPVVKDALQMCLDKESWVSGFLNGLAAPADSLIGPKNEFHYDYGSRPGETPYAFDPAAARAMLNAAGWTYDINKNLDPNATPLCKLGGTDPLTFRFWTLNDGLDQSDWNVGAVMISDWAWQAGIDLKSLYSQQSMSFMNGAWAAADYDCWLWDWWFGSTSEASSDIMSVLTTGAIGSWSDVYWRNATYDDMYNQSLIETDFATRYNTLADMQAMAYEESGCVPLAYRAELFAATNQGPDQWTNWGNWTQNWLLSPGELPWLYMQIYPMTNHAPTVTVGQASFPGYVDTPTDVYGSATDASDLQYQWYWGDGTESGWLSSASATHIYDVDGIYDVYFGAREVNGTPSENPSYDGFICSARCQIVIINPAIPPPTIESVWMSPSTGIQMWTVVKFQANATGTPPLFYSWDFGDGHTGTGRVVNHTFDVGGSYLVVLNVDDGHPGPGRPAVATRSVSVAINTPPMISIMSSQTVIWKTKTFFNASAYDAEDALRFTWVWGDGSVNVTTSSTLVTHTYSQKATYSLYVYADDLTVLPGHNVSARCTVTVEAGPSPPFGLTLSANRTSIWVTQSVEFTAVAQDPAGDGLHFSINCGDGTYVNMDTPGTANNAVVTAKLRHTYMSAGTHTARLYVTDGLTNTTGSTPVLVTATLNTAPSFVVAPANRAGYSGSSISFTVTATDPDETTLRYTWNFGDGTPLQSGSSATNSPNVMTHVYAKAGIFTYTVFVSDQSGLGALNVSGTAQARAAFNLPLVTGWNLITVPLVGWGYKASNLSGLVTGDMICKWNSTTQAYSGTYIKGISGSAQDFNILPNTGYWVWVAAQRTLHLYGIAPSATQNQTVTVPVSGGWVAIGLESQKTTLKASNLAAMYSGTGAITMIAWFNQTTKVYKTWLSAVGTLNNFVLVPGQAYWCWVTGSGWVSYPPQ